MHDAGEFTSIQGDVDAGTIDELVVKPGTIEDNSDRLLHFTMLQFGEYQPQNAEYLSSGFVCSNFSVGLKNETDSYEYATEHSWSDMSTSYPLNLHDLLANSDVFSIHILHAPSSGATFDDASDICYSRNMFPAVILNEERNNVVSNANNN